MTQPPAGISALRHLETDSDPLIPLMSADNYFLTPKLRFNKKISLPTRAGPSPDDDRRGLAINQALRSNGVILFLNMLSPTIVSKRPNSL